MTDIKTIMTQAPIMPVLVIDDVADAVPLAEALKGAGLTVLEVTLRTPAALDAIKAIAAEVDGVIVGAGTVVTPQDLDAVVTAGGEFAISPGATPALLEAGKSCGIPYLPAVSTVSDIMQAMEYGYGAFKFFPAEASGGKAALKSFAGPFPDLVFCPTGGINGDNYQAYLNLPNVSIVGGSWIVPQDLVQKKDWVAIEILAAQAVTAVKA